MAMLALTSSATWAQPIRLACEGETRTITGRIDKDWRTITIDFAAKTVTVEYIHPAPITRITEEEVSFASKNPQNDPEVLIGFINRFTGAVHVEITNYSDARIGLHSFDGTCKPAQKLF
jgi:hypothetical protein